MKYSVFYQHLNVTVERVSFDLQMLGHTKKLSFKVGIHIQKTVCNWSCFIKKAFADGVIGFVRSQLLDGVTTDWPSFWNEGLWGYPEYFFVTDWPLHNSGTHTKESLCEIPKKVQTQVMLQGAIDIRNNGRMA